MAIAGIPNVALDNRPLSVPAPAASSGGDIGGGSAGGVAGRWWAPTFGYRALCEIAAGSELLICYASTTESTSVRAEELWASYGFKCGCRCGNAVCGNAIFV
jgi:hypothetical protein